MVNTYIELGKQRRPVSYNNLALEEFQEITKVEMSDIAEALQKHMKNVTALAYVGLKHGFLEVCDYKEECPFTYKDVGRWLDVSKTGEIFRAYASAMPKGEGEPTEEAESKKSVGAMSGA